MPVVSHKNMSLIGARLLMCGHRRDVGKGFFFAAKAAGRGARTRDATPPPPLQLQCIVLANGGAAA